MHNEPNSEFFFNKSAPSWLEALKLLEHFQRQPGKADLLLERLPDRIQGVERRRVQVLFMSAVRHALWIEHSLKPLLRRPPQPRLRAILHLACGEMQLREAEARAAVVDFAVEQAKKMCSKAEGDMVNAVLRKVVHGMHPEALKKLPMYVRYSHPKWLVEQWRSEHDLETVRAWLEWNQQAPEVFVRLFGEASSDLPKEFEETEWTGFVRVRGEHWRPVEQLMRAGLAYVQDPSTRIPITLLRPRAGETILDLCAAPGGKSVSIARALGQSGRLVAVDLPGRMQRLRDNLGRTGVQNFSILECDVLHFAEEAKRLDLPQEYDAVLIDAPCSNTGVLRRRPDAKWRLTETSLHAMPAIQLRLLQEAARFVRPGGRLVYSTCSIETEENQGVAEQFLETHQDTFTLDTSQLYYPHPQRHDGGGTFLFLKL